MARYTDEQKASLVVMLQSEGYPDTPGALKKVAGYANIPTRTLRRWFKGEHTKPPDKLVRQKKQDLASKFENVAYAMLDHVGDTDVIEEMKGKDAVMSAAIATDKMRLLRGLPTEIVAIMPEFVKAVERLGQSPVDVMSRIVERSNRMDDSDLQH